MVMMTMIQRFVLISHPGKRLKSLALMFCTLFKNIVSINGTHSNSCTKIRLTHPLELNLA
jgi:hypothetical protein